MLEGDGVIDGGRCACWEETRGKQVAFARGDQLRALEDVDVLIDELANSKQEVIINARSRIDASDRFLSSLLKPKRLLDDPLGDGRGSGRTCLDLCSELRRKVVTDDERERKNWNYCTGDETRGTDVG